MSEVSSSNERVDLPRVMALDTVRRVAAEQKSYRLSTIADLKLAAELLEQADRALVATIRMMRGGSDYVQAVARTEVEKYHAMCGRPPEPRDG